MSNQFEQTNKKGQHTKGLIKTFLVILAILALLISLLYTARLKAHREERRARLFLEQVITSIQNDSSFYHNYVGEDIANLIKSYLNETNQSYKIELIDFDPGHYEYEVIFGDYETIGATVIDINDVLHISFRLPTVSW